MSASRFLTASEVYDTFPQMLDVLAAPATSAAPPDFARSLAASPTPEDAITFCAFTLGRREAVWWACQCVRHIMGEDGEGPGLKAAEDWVRTPDDDVRQAALQLGMSADKNDARSWLALAAGWSGGTIVPASPTPVPPAPHLTATAARSAILIALARVPAKERSERLQRCLSDGLRMLERPSSG